MRRPPLAAILLASCLTLAACTSTSHPVTTSTTTTSPASPPTTPTPPDTRDWTGTHATTPDPASPAAPVRAIVLERYTVDITRPYPGHDLSRVLPLTAGPLADRLTAERQADATPDAADQASWQIATSQHRGTSVELLDLPVTRSQSQPDTYYVRASYRLVTPGQPDTTAEGWYTVTRSPQGAWLATDDVHPQSL